MDDGLILDLLHHAVKLHLRSDVPVGLLLSGGLESSAIAAMASEGSCKMTAICVGYSGAHLVDERSRARRTAEHFGLEFLELEQSVIDFNSHFDSLMDCCDEPVGDIAALAQWGLYKASRRAGFKVLLSGLGGDEIMYGYPFWNRLGESLRTLHGDRGTHIRFIASAFAEYLGNQTHRVARGALAETASKSMEAFLASCPVVSKGPDEIGAALFGSYLVNNGCQLADKLGMGCSVEVRVPLLDHVLVESVLGLPLSKRFHPSQSKPLLRRVMHNILPEELLQAPKQGFSPPMSYIYDLIYGQGDVLRSGQLVRSGWIDAKRLEAIMRGGSTFKWMNSHKIRKALGIERSEWFLFRLLSFERWFDQITSISSKRLEII